MQIKLIGKRIFEYQDAFVAFIDVLGFKSLMNSEKHDAIGVYFGIIDQIRTEGADDKGLNIISISDSLVFTLEKREGHELQQLSQLCEKVRHPKGNC